MGVVSPGGGLAGPSTPANATTASLTLDVLPSERETLYRAGIAAAANALARAALRQRR